MNPDLVPNHARMRAGLQSLGPQQLALVIQNLDRELGGLNGAAIRAGENQRRLYACLTRNSQNSPQFFLAFGSECALRIGLARVTLLGDSVPENVDLHSW